MSWQDNEFKPLAVGSGGGAARRSGGAPSIIYDEGAGALGVLGMGRGLSLVPLSPGPYTRPLVTSTHAVLSVKPLAVMTKCAKPLEHLV